MTRRLLQKHYRLPWVSLVVTYCYLPAYRRSGGGTTFRWKRTAAVFVFLVVVFLFYSTATSSIRPARQARESRKDSKDVSLDDKGVRNPECIGADATPKVALMFLTTGKLHNEPTWRAFFEAAGRLCLLHRTPFDLTSGKDVGRKLQRVIPSGDTISHEPDVDLSDDVQSISTDPFVAGCLQSPMSATRRWTCSDEETMIEEEASRLMFSSSSTESVSPNQLFTVYVNSIAYGDDEGEKSIFKNHIVPDPIDTGGGYAQYPPVKATLRMIHFALKETRNRKFVLLSESCVPIHPPEVIHVQLLTEPRSRLNACQHGNRNIGRWNRDIVSRQYWRKSSQFFALRRSHAQLAADDNILRPKFRQYCYTTWNPVTRLCIADEHYFPTLMAFNEQDNKTDCQGYVTSSEWDTYRDAWHPVSYQAERVNAALFRRLASSGKSTQDCSIDRVRATTGALYGGFTTNGCRHRDFHPSPYVNSTLWVHPHSIPS